MAVRVQITTVSDTLVTRQRAIAALVRGMRSSSPAKAMGSRLLQVAKSTVEANTPRPQQKNRPLFFPSGAPTKTRRTGGLKLYRGWRRETTLASASEFVGRVFNIADQDGYGSPGNRVLGAVEFGSKPHAMLNGPYAWMGSDIKRGETQLPQFLGRDRGRKIMDVYLRGRQRRVDNRFEKINHPGMQGFGMVEISRKALADAAQRIGRAYVSKIIEGLSTGVMVDVTSVGAGPRII